MICSLQIQFSVNWFKDHGIANSPLAEGVPVCMRCTLSYSIGQIIRPLCSLFVFCLNIVAFKINFIFCKIVTTVWTYVITILVFWISLCSKINLFLTYAMHPEEFCCHGYKFVYTYLIKIDK